MVARGVGDVAGVADGRLHDPPGLLRRLDRHLHVVDVVERVEDAEHVHPGLGRLFDEGHHHVVGVVGVADGIGAADQHLEHHVRDLLAQLVEPHPGILRQEAIGDVEGRAAPHLQRKEIGARCAVAGATREIS